MNKKTSKASLSNSRTKAIKINISKILPQQATLSNQAPKQGIKLVHERSRPLSFRDMGHPCWQLERSLEKQDTWQHYVRRSSHDTPVAQFNGVSTNHSSKQLNNTKLAYIASPSPTPRQIFYLIFQYIHSTCKNLILTRWNTQLFCRTTVVITFSRRIRSWAEFIVIAWLKSTKHCTTKQCGQLFILHFRR